MVILMNMVHILCGEFIIGFSSIGTESLSQAGEGSDHDVHMVCVGIVLIRGE